MERSFGQQSLVHTPLRNSLSDESIEAEVYIRMNFAIAFPDDPIVLRLSKGVSEEEELE